MHRLAERSLHLVVARANTEIGVLREAHLGGVDLFHLNVGNSHLATELLALNIPFTIHGDMRFGENVHFNSKTIRKLATNLIDKTLRTSFPICGSSAHNIEEALTAYRYCKPDYLFVGTIFASPSHPDREPAGPNLIHLIKEQLSNKVPVPSLIAIGGITPDNIPQVIANGASGVAVVSNILNDSDPRLAAKKLKLKLISS